VPHLSAAMRSRLELLRRVAEGEEWRHYLAEAESRLEQSA